MTKHYIQYIYVFMRGKHFYIEDTLHGLAVLLRFNVLELCQNVGILNDYVVLNAKLKPNTNAKFCPHALDFSGKRCKVHNVTIQISGFAIKTIHSGLNMVTMRGALKHPGCILTIIVTQF